MGMIVEKAGIYFGVMFLLSLVLELPWSSPKINGTGAIRSYGSGSGAILLSGIWRGLCARNADSRLLDAVKTESPDRVAVLASWRRTAWIDVAIILFAVWAMVAKLGV